jgi:cyclophilin family peptidyl-prolyl cis-trans isomerase
MTMSAKYLAALAVLPLLALTAASAGPPKPVAPKVAPKTSADIIAAAPAGDWRPLDPTRTLYMDLSGGRRVIIELAPDFAPKHFANLKTLVQEHYFDGLWIERAQDNYVVQWGDADTKKPTGLAKTSLEPEFDAPIGSKSFTPLPDPDTYAKQVGFTDGFAVGRDPKAARTWLAHCYGAVGVGRDNALTSGPGTELYAVIGNAPRHLDRNIALIGRVVKGIDLLSVMPRGTGPLGFYEKPEQRTPIVSIRFASDVPPAEQTKLEIMRTDSKSFAALVHARRFPAGPWFVAPVGHVELCNMNVPSRVVK